MTHRASFVLSLCFALATPLGARAQSPAAPAPAAPPPAVAPATDVAPVPADPNAPAAPAPAKPPTAEAPADPAAPAAPAAPVDPNAAPAAPVDPNAAPVDPNAAPAVPVDPTAAPAALDVPPAPAPVEPAPAPMPPEPQPAPAAASAEIKVDAGAAKQAAADKKSDEQRCAQLFAQGQTALAQAEGCSSGDTPIYAGSQFAFTQTTAPAYATLPDDDNGFYAMSLYLAPRFRLTETWALFTDVTLAYEATVPDDTNQRHEVQSSNTRIVVAGLLGSLGGVAFQASPRLVIPTSKFAWSAKMIAGVGTGLSASKSFEVLSGLGVSLGGAYTHTFSNALTRQIREGDPPVCTGTAGQAIDCQAGGLRIVQDNFVIGPSVNLAVNDQWSVGASYSYAWALAKPWDDSVKDSIVIDTLGGPSEVDVSDNPVEDNRWRRSGSFSVSANYQPAPWLIATLSGNTSVCYAFDVGFQSSTGGCAGGNKNSDWWLRNPIANKFSTISLSLTVPVDALIEAVTKKETEAKTARGKSKSKI